MTKQQPEQTDVDTGSKKIPLSKPVTVDQRKYDHLNLRTEVVAGDHINVGHILGNPAQQEAALFANLCEVDPKVISRLCMPDYFDLQAAYKVAVGEAPEDPKT